MKPTDAFSPRPGQALGHPAFGPPLTLPFLPGDSPFRQKGNGYLGDRRYYDSVIAGGARAVGAALSDPNVRRFFEQTFRPSEWYDALPGVIIESTAARLAGVSFEQHRRQIGAWHAAESIRGIYSALFKLVSTENVALWTSRLSALYFEFGKVHATSLDSRTVEASYRGLPCELAQNVIYGSAGFCVEALRRTGAVDPVMTIHEVDDDGVAHGRKVVRVRVRLGWR